MDVFKCPNCGLWIKDSVTHSCEPRCIAKPTPEQEEFVKNSYFHQFKDDPPEGAYGWMQWKGTSGCVDLHCTCGASGHLDIDFMYFVKCKACGKLWHVSGYIKLLPIEGDDLVRYNKSENHEPIEFGD